MKNKTTKPTKPTNKKWIQTGLAFTGKTALYLFVLDIVSAIVFTYIVFLK